MKTRSQILAEQQAKPTASKLDKYLQKHGLSTLADAKNLLDQLSLGIADHKKFRYLLMKMHPEQRRACYDAMAPRLMFKAKPLEDYELEMKAIANQMYRQLNRSQLEVLAEDAMKQGAAKAELIIECGKCTRVEKFKGETRVDSISMARKAGWVLSKNSAGEEIEVCPKCPAVRLAN